MKRQFVERQKLFGTQYMLFQNVNTHLVAALMNVWMEMYDASSKLNVYSITYSIVFK